MIIIEDDYSRAISGYYLSFDHPCAINTALALRQAIWRKQNPAWQICGIPEILYTDNGSDFISEHIKKVGIALKIQLVNSIPGRLQGKGKVERFFLTLLHQLLEQLPGYAPKGNTKVAATLNLEQLSAKLENFILHVYHQTPHSTTGMSPIDRWIGDGVLPQLFPFHYKTGRSRRFAARQGGLGGEVYFLMLRHQKIDFSPTHPPVFAPQGAETNVIKETSFILKGEYLSP